MGRAIGLEDFREIFRDNRVHIAIAKIKRLSLVDDRSALKCLVSVFPEQREVIARMSFEMTGPNSGIVEFPAVNDLVLIGFADGDNDLAFVIRRLTSLEDKIPLNAVDGHLVLKAKSGKNVWVTSDNNIMLSKGDNAPTENLVLGQQLKTFLVDLLTELKTLSDKVKELATELATHQHPGNLGYPTGAPVTASQFTQISGDVEGVGTNLDNLKSSPVEDENILSDFAFTEKGS